MASGAESTSCAKRSGASAMGQAHREYRTGIAVLDANAAALRLHGDPTEREPESAPGAGDRAILALHLDEGVEDALSHFGRHAGARVLHAELDATLVRFAAEPHHGVFRRVSQRVVEQVLEHALEQIRICPDLRRTVGRLQANRPGLG